MATKKPLGNPSLIGMFITGGALLLLGLIVWAATGDTDPSAYREQASPGGQLFGMFMVGFGGMLVILGWAAAAICRQIADRE